MCQNNIPTSAASSSLLRSKLGFSRTCCVQQIHCKGCVSTYADCAWIVVINSPCRSCAAGGDRLNKHLRRQFKYRHRGRRGQSFHMQFQPMEIMSQEMNHINWLAVGWATKPKGLRRRRWSGRINKPCQIQITYLQRKTRRGTIINPLKSCRRMRAYLLNYF